MYVLEIRERLKEHSKLQLLDLKLDLTLDKLSLPTRFTFYFGIY